jgi:general secretion pathway protein G
MQLKKQNRRRRGFTLIEIMLVVGIIAMLAAFVVPSFLRAGERARIQTAEALVGTGGRLAGAIDMFHLAMGRYPEELSELVEKPDDDEEDKWDGPYITDIESLKDPWGHELRYTAPGDVREGAYDLCSDGPDGDEGGDDDICNYKTED